MKTLQQIKDEHAKELGYDDYENLFSEAFHTGVQACVDLIAIKYANEKLQQASDAQTPQFCVELTQKSILSFKQDENIIQ